MQWNGWSTSDSRYYLVQQASSPHYEQLPSNWKRPTGLCQEQHCHKPSGSCHSVYTLHTHYTMSSVSNWTQEGQWILRTLYFTYSIHCIQCTLNTVYILHSVHSTQCNTTQCTYYTVYILHSVHPTQCTYYTVYILHSVHTTQCTYYTVYILHSVHTAQCTFYTVYILRIVHTTQCT